jgi:hypothetical protein
MPQKLVTMNVKNVRFLDTALQAPSPDPIPRITPPSRLPPMAKGVPALYVIEEYQLVTVPGDIGVTRNVVGTLSIPGNAKRTKFVKTRHVVAQSGTVTQTALESQDTAVIKNMSDSVSASSEQSRSADQSNFKFDGSFHGEVSAGLTGGSADADAHASTSSREVRDAYQDAVKQAISQQVSQTAQFRQEQAVSVSDTHTDTKEDESIETFEIDNTHSSEGQNYLLCQLAAERLSALCLVNAKIGLFNARTGESILRPLSGLISLVGSVIAPEHQKAVLDAILAQLATVFDYQDQPRTFVQRRTEGGTDFFQVVPNLTTKVELARPNGAIKVFTVPGIAIKTYDNVLPIPQFGLAKGIGN